tara:strand:+ start:1402 stop:1668 length:267 start_codon:yes stop_codon:yes gene_type:complete
LGDDLSNIVIYFLNLSLKGFFYESSFFTLKNFNMHFFLMAGFGKVMDPQGTMKYMMAMGMPFTGFFLICTIIIELGGGLSLLLGYKAE